MGAEGWAHAPWWRVRLRTMGAAHGMRRPQMGVERQFQNGSRSRRTTLSTTRRPGGRDQGSAAMPPRHWLTNAAI
jgi:hypothetical protein